MPRSCSSRVHLKRNSIAPVRRLLLLMSVIGAACGAGAASATAGTTWLCRPGLARNPCDPGLSTTRFSPAGANLGRERVRRQRQPAVDCFYVYPTVSDQKGPLADFGVDPEERSIALYQAARYSQYCRVFAPVYRQVTVPALDSGTVETPAQLAIPLSDVRSAFHDYLKRYNRGRGIVLIGHSQGSFVLRELIAQDVDAKPSVRRRLVSAILLGGDVQVKAGSNVGGDFRHIAGCASARQVGCVIAFSTYNAPPPAGTLFGAAAKPGYQVLCTNPVALDGAASTDTIFPSAPFAPGTLIALGIRLLHVTLPSAPTTWVHVPGAFAARCSSEGAGNVLRIAPLAGAPVFTPSPSPVWGLHLVDANIALGNLVDLVRKQGAAWTKRNRH